MPKNALNNPIVLATLGALLECPSHAYGLAMTLSGQNLPVNRGSLYDTLDAMARAGWVKAAQPEQPGKRPKRTVYSITKLGQQELIRRLDAQLRTVRRESPEFLSAIAHVGILGKKRALHALTERHAQLGIQLSEDQCKLEKATQNNVPRLFIIEAEYALALLSAEYKWVSGIIKGIKTGKISWPKAQQYHREAIDGDVSGDRTQNI